MPPTVKARRVEVLILYQDASAGITVVLVRLEYSLLGSGWRRLQAKGVSVRHHNDRWSYATGLREAVRHVTEGLPWTLREFLAPVVWAAALPQIQAALRMDRVGTPIEPGPGRG